MAQKPHMTNNPHAAAHAAAVRNAQAQDDALDLLHKRTAAKRQLEQPTATEQPDAEQLADASAAQATDGTLLVASAEGVMAASGGDAAAGVVGATASADAASAAGVGAAGAAGTGAAAGTAAAVSPMAIGLGVLGVAAVGAAAGGGGGSSSAPAPSAQAKPGNDQLAQQEPGKQPNTNPQTPADGQPRVDADKPGTDNDSQQPGNPGGTPSAEAQPGGDTPPPQSGASGPAIAQGTANAPKVAVDGETRLTNAKAAFEAAKPAGYDGEVKYIKITHIESSHDAKHPNARVVRWGNDDGNDKSAAAGTDHDAQGLGGVHASLTRLASVVKVEAVNAQAGDADDKGGTVNAKVDAENGKAAAAGEQPVKLTGYEVITSDKPLTLAEARAEATRLGGKLLEIDDQDELSWLQKNLQARLSEGKDGTRPAWIGNNKVELTDADPSKDNALTLEGDKPANFKVVPQHEAGEKLNRFVIEYDDYQVPLTLDGNPVVEGQIIHADEFDRLVWNGSQSEAGTIRYIAMNGDGDDAKELPNAEESSIHVTESADVKALAAPGTPPLPAPQAGHDDVNGNHKEQPAGDNKQGQNAKPDADNKQPGQDGHKNSGNNTPAAQDDSQHGQGDAGQGSSPPNGSGSGAAHGEVTLPKAPVYNPDHQTANVGYNDKTAKIDASIFRGENPAQQPDAVKILEGNGHLLFRGKPVIDGETIVQKSDFDKLTWDARGVDGGEFRFIPVKANKEHFKESEIEGKIEAQTIRIHEAAAPLPPRYPDGNSQTTHVGHDSVQKLGADLFNGSNGERKPAFIKITGFEETGATDDNAHSPLTLNKGGVAATEISTANGSNLVRQADFQNLLWDTSTNSGGTIRFIPVDQNGDPLPHTTEQTIHISEMSDQPYYGNDGQSVNVAHDEASHALKAEIFTGKDGKVPEAVKIDYIVDGKGNPITGAALTVGEGDNAKTIEARDFIDKADFARVHWNASLAEGGQFRFTAVDAQHQDIPGHVQNRTITIVEAPAPAANSGDEHAAETTQTGEHAAVTTQHEHQSQEAEQHSQEDKLTPPPKQEGEKTDTTTTDTTTPENGQKPAAGEEQHPGASGHDSQPSGEESGTPGSAPAGGKPAEGAGHGASEDPTGSQKPAGETGVGGGVQKDASDQQDPNATQSQGTDPKGEVVTEDHSSDPKASSTVPGGEKQESDSDKASGDPSDKGHAPPVSDPPETTHNENPSGGQNAVNQSGQSDSDSGKANVGGGDQQGNTGATQTHQAESAVNGQSGSDGVSELRHESAAHSPRSVLKSVHALQFDDLLSDDGQTYGEAPAPAHDSLYIHSSTDMGHLVPMNPEVTHL